MYPTHSGVLIGGEASLSDAEMTSPSPKKPQAGLGTLQDALGRGFPSGLLMELREPRKSRADTHGQNDSEVTFMR